VSTYKVDDKNHKLPIVRDVQYEHVHLSVASYNALVEIARAAENYLIETRQLHRAQFGYPRWVEVGIDLERALHSLRQGAS
jgi:hypothetical protein